VIVHDSHAMGRGTSGAALDRHCLMLCSAQLSLTNDQIGAAGAAELAKALMANRTLEYVRCAPQYAFSS